MNRSGGPAEESLHLISLGCPKNLVDSEIMLGELVKSGYRVTDDPQAASTLIVNTCGFIEDAKKESIATILEMAKLKTRSEDKKRLVVTGCLAQRYKDELVVGLPEVDIFIGSGEFQNVSRILEKFKTGKAQKSYYSLPTYLQQDGASRLNSQPFYRAYLKISEGCMKSCAFCAIPLIRGGLQSRKLKSVINEARLLAAGGVRELIVISHDFTDYGRDLRKKDSGALESPVQLLTALTAVDGVDWLRVLYLYPDCITTEFVSFVKFNPKMAKYFDMPLQHVSDRVLKRMNRATRKESIIRKLDLIRNEIPDAVIRTQFIVGFPGETDEDFDELLDFVAGQQLDHVGCFVFSPEEGTRAATLDHPVAFEIANERREQLMSFQQSISKKKMKRHIGKIVPVIVEGISDESEYLLRGRTSQQSPEIDGIVYINSGQADVGSIVLVRITDSHSYDLVGEIVAAPAVLASS